MEERELRQWIQRVKDGTITRREFTRMMVGVGLTAPLAAQMLASSGIGGVAQAQTKPAFTPTKRGGGGPVKVLWWQSPPLLNPHFANGTKDQDGSRIFYEPLASFDPDGNLMEQGGKGRVEFAVSGNIEHVNVNQTDPWTEVDGERSSVKTKQDRKSVV